MAKSSPRTMRLDEAVEVKIGKLPGNNFTEKFEYLVNDYYNTIPQRKEKVSQLEARVKILIDTYSKMQKEIQEMSVVRDSIRGVVHAVDTLVKKTNNRFDQFKEDLEDDM